MFLWKKLYFKIKKSLEEWHCFPFLQISLISDIYLYVLIQTAVVSHLM